MNVPQHLAIIMDGNGRWATQRSQPRFFGHQAGFNNAKQMIATCMRLGVKTLSLFVFSCENWQRPNTEVKFLMQLIQRAIDDGRTQLFEQNIRVRFIGDRLHLPLKLQQSMSDLESLTQNNHALDLVLAINFSGTWSILETTKNLLMRGIDPNFLTSRDFTSARPIPDLPDIDLLIRTSGELRLSNFFLWEAAYAELYFTDCYFPDFDDNELLRAIASFQQRQRRYGSLTQGFLCENE